MIKTHELNLNSTAYNALLNTNSAIILDDTERGISENDYVLFKQVETIGEETQETGLYMFLKIKKVVSDHAGLNEGYIMITYDKID